MNSRLLDQLSVVKEVAAVIDREQPKAVVFIGDLFNGVTESLPKIIYNAGYLTAQAWSKNTQIYMVVGNHDIYRGMHVFSTFESIPNVHVVSHTVQVAIDSYLVDLIPWGDSLPKVAGDICVGHLELHGAIMEWQTGYRCESGLNPSSLAPYKMAILGHFHTPQSVIIPSSTCECRYIGAVMQTDRRTTSKDALGVTLLEDGKLRLVTIRSPRIYEYRISSKEDKQKFIEEVLDDQNYFRVIVTSPEVDFTETLDRVLIEYDLPEVSTSRLGLTPEMGPWSSSVKLAVDAWIEQANTKLDKDLLKATAKELLNEG
jgi:DNA repair exonuclease SbcCD nuclease subunit